jgi:hypothetical protein
MATWNDVRRYALALPETTEEKNAWKVKDKGFVWERPLRKADFAALGDAAPKGAILGVRTADLAMKEALLARDPDVYFTTPHFDGYPAVLVKLGRIKAGELKDLILEAWLARAPERLAETYLRTCLGRPGFGRVRSRKATRNAAR